MKTVTLKLPERLAAEIAAESRERRISKSEVMRERLEGKKRPARRAAHLDSIADLIGSVDGLPEDLSSRVDGYLRKTGFGRNRSR